jgi:hypothetical protein
MQQAAGRHRGSFHQETEDQTQGSQQPVARFNKSDYKPLVALNIDIGENSPVKIFIYNFTNPWKRAYEFLKTYDLPEEMHEDIALLIEKAKLGKEQELMALQQKNEQKKANDVKIQELINGGKQKQAQHEVQRSRNGSQERNEVETRQEARKRGVNFEGGNETMKRNNSVRIMTSQENRRQKREELVFNGKNKQELIDDFPDVTESQINAKSNEASALQSQTVEGKSQFLDSTTLMSSSGEKLKHKGNCSPFESKIIEEIVDLEYSVYNNNGGGAESGSNSRNSEGGHLSARAPSQDDLHPKPKQTSPMALPPSVKNIAANFGPILPSPSPPLPSIPKKDQVKIRYIFDKLDYEFNGQIRSYDVYLSDLPSDVKNGIHAVLSARDSKDSFQPFDHTQFEALLYSSKEYEAIRNKELY